MCAVQLVAYDACTLIAFTSPCRSRATLPSPSYIEPSAFHISHLLMFPDQAPALVTPCSAVYLLVHTYTEAHLYRDGEPSPAPGTPSHSRSLLEPGGWAAAKPYATHTLHSHRPSACLAGPDKCARHLDHPWCTRRHTLSASNDQIPGRSHSSHLLPFELSSRLPTGVSILEPLPLASFILASWANATSLCILCNRSVQRPSCRLQ